MNGATLQLYAHENLPHVFHIYAHMFLDLKIFNDGWHELGSFVDSVAHSDDIVSKTVEIRWDGSNEAIEEDKFITITPDQVIILPLAMLTLANGANASIRRFSYNALQVSTIG